MSRIVRHFAVWSVLATVAFTGQVGWTQEQLDRVVIRNNSKHSRTTLYGRIQDFSGGILTVRMSNRNVIKSVAEKDIVHVETPLVESHIKALQSFRENKFDEARRLLQTALKEETRRWVHQDIRALLVQVEGRVGDHTAAMLQFARLIRLDAKTRHFHLIPLVWASRVTNGREQSAARSLMSQSEPALRLMGASVSISDERNRPFGEAELEALASSGKPRIQHLARTQLWRLRLREGEVRPGELTGWRSRLRTMPEKLRAGPYYLLGKAHLGRHEYDKASIAFLRLPIVYDEDYRLAARACLDAAEALSAAGRKIEAETLYREVATRFSDTPDAAVANTALRAPASEDAGGDKALKIDE
jgi:tetratricopeptide (TPR) repeat protein